MKNADITQNKTTKNITKLLSIAIFIVWSLLIIGFIITFAMTLNDDVAVVRSLGLGYLFAGIMPLIVMIFTLRGGLELFRSAFFLSVYYWLQSIFSAALPFLVDIQASFVYYLLPYVLGTVATFIAYVLLKRKTLADHWGLLPFFIVTLVAMTITFAVSL